MTKAERLLYLVNMIKNRGAVLVSEMTAECGVSQRTIYRDLNSLSRMNIPIYYNNGYRLLGDTWLPLMQLSAEEMQLICYTLRNNPLVSQPFFQKKFREIEQKVVTGKNKKNQSDSKELFLFDKASELPPKNRESMILGEFLRAISESCKVELTFFNGVRRPGTFLPIAVKLKKPEPVLLVATENSPIAEEMQISDVELIRVVDEKFAYRPLDTSMRGLASLKRT